MRFNITTRSPTYLIASDGQSDIYYGPIKEYLARTNATDGPFTQQIEVNEMRELVVNLKFKPTSMEYCYMSQVLYVCMG